MRRAARYRRDLPSTRKAGEAAEEGPKAEAPATEASPESVEKAKQIGAAIRSAVKGSVMKDKAYIADEIANALQKELSDKFASGQQTIVTEANIEVRISPIIKKIIG